MSQSIFSILKENLILLWINIKVKISNLIEYTRVVIRYYPHVNFAKIDAALLLSYVFSNPFRISKHLLVQKGEQEIYTYGETPLTTLELIVRNCEIRAQDSVFELGCGRGRTCFWLNQFVGCTVVGIDYIPTFIAKANKIKDRFGIQNISFRLEDLFQADLKGATVIYLYGTCFSAAYIDLLIDRLSALPKGTKIITVSYALTEFQPESPFRVIKQFSASFTWGETDVYLQVKRTA
jgi:SAM-dependent methyltransferase